jgi:hypothetical protein
VITLIAMKRSFAVIISLGLAITLGGCVASDNAGNDTNSARPTPTPDQALVPEAPAADAVAADSAMYDTGFDWYSFKVGDGPTWCTIDAAADNVVCEQNEAAAQYEPVPAPEDCQGSYGYQIQLWANQPENGDMARFTCSSGQYQDPSVAQVLPSGQTITVASITCYVEQVTARCENENGQWIAMGPQTWSLHN